MLLLSAHKHYKHAACKVTIVYPPVDWTLTAMYVRISAKATQFDIEVEVELTRHFL